MTLSYNHVVQTRYLYAGPRKSGWAVCAGVELHCYFDDTDGLTVALSSNNGKLIGTCSFSQERQSGLVADNTKRHSIWIGCREGLAGNFFDVTTTKVVPSDGDWHYEGVNVALEPLEREAEYQDGAGALTGATTFVVEADASPEVNAYA